MAFRIVIRRGSTVQRSRAPTLTEALARVEQAARDTARSERRAPVDLRRRTFAPSQQVAARIEVVGAGVRAGVDVHGDGSMTAHTGRWRRAPVDEREDETALAALRRTLGEGVS
jgi:hypothetical protein